MLTLVRKIFLHFIISKCTTVYLTSSTDSPTPFSARHPRQWIVSRCSSSWTRLGRRWRRRPPARAPGARARQRPSGTFRTVWLGREVRPFFYRPRRVLRQGERGLSARFFCDDFPIAPYHVSPPRNTNEESASVCCGCGRTYTISLVRGWPCLDDEFSPTTLEKYRPCGVLVFKRNDVSRHDALMLVENALLLLSGTWAAVRARSRAISEASSWNLAR